MKCLILAAGYATRLYPLTENFPKPLLKVAGKPILDHLIDDLQLTSLDIMDVAMYIEEEFGIVLEEEDLADISTVQSFMDLL